MTKHEYKHEYKLVDLKTHHVAIGGRVKIVYTIEGEDEPTELPVPRALVKIIDASESFQRQLQLKFVSYGQQWQSVSNHHDRTLTTIDGSFYFMDLPEGSYKVRASVLSANFPSKTSFDDEKSFQINENQPRWEVEKSFEIVKKTPDNNKNKPEWIELIMATSGITGQVIGKGSSPVAYAQVKFKDSKEETLCDRDGKFQLLNLHAPEAPSTRSVQLEISASGYKEFTTDQINLSQGVVHRIKPIQLTKTNPT